MAERTDKHFGETLRASKYSHRLTRDEYALVNKTSSTRVPREMYSCEMWASLNWADEDEEHTRLSDDFCTRHREAALENFDLNMAFLRRFPRQTLTMYWRRSWSRTSDFGR